MKGFFRRLFNIYAGEERNALRFAFLGFLWALAVTSGLKFADALFLIHVGAASLPITYMWTACIMIVMAAFMLQAFNHFSLHKIFIGVLLSGASFYAFAYFCLANHIGIETKWLWFVLRIFGAIFFAVVMTNFWTFVDQYYHLQDAKRLYSLFSSMIFLGIASTGMIMRSGMIEFQNLTIFIIALLIIAAIWVGNIAKKVQPVYDENAIEVTGDHPENTFRFLFKAALSSKFTLLLMASNFLMYLLLVITEYSYMSDFDQRFDPTASGGSGGEEKAALTLFLGQLIAGVSIINLIFGLFIYSRLIRRFGISNLILYTPILLLITFSGWSVTDTLLFPIMGFLVVEGMLYTVDDNNFTLLLNAVPPKVKYKIRLMIESFFEPIGMLVSSLLITFVPVNSKTLGLLLSGVALLVVLMLRQNYLKAIFQNLLENAIHFQRSVRDWFSQMTRKEQQAAERRLLAILYRGNEQERLFAIEGLLGFGDESILPQLLLRADHFNNTAKITFLNMIGQTRFAKDNRFLEWLHTLALDDRDPQLNGAVHFYLAKLGLLHPDKVSDDLESSDLTLKGAAILSMQESWAHLPPEIVAQNRTLAAQHLQELLSSKNEEEVCMGITILGIDGRPQDVHTLLPFLKQPSIKIARSAASAISQLADRQTIRYAPALISKLFTANDSEIRQSCLVALGKIADSTLVREIIGSSVHFRPSERRLTETIISKMGLRTVPTLLAITKDTSMHDRCRLLAGRTLGRLALAQLRAHLYGIITVEIERAYFYYYHEQTIQQSYPDTDLTILKDALHSSFYSVLDFIIQLLGVAGEIEDCELLSRSLRSPNPKVRSQVLETLERTCEPFIFRALYPLIADLPKTEKIQAYLKEGRAPLSLTELLDKMSRSSMNSDQIMAAALKYQLNLPHWRDSLRRQMATHEEIFHHFAYELLET